MYDIIIIGAGPTGCTAAKTLSEQGYRVLMAERFPLPRYKSCSGVLIQKTLDLVLQYFGESVPTSVMCTPTENRGMIFTNDKGREYVFQQPGSNVWRSSFDHWLAVKAVEQGTELRDNTSVLTCEEQEDFVTLTLHGSQTYTETARYILDCEGVTGSFKRKFLSAPSSADPQYITTYQTFNQGSVGLDPHYFYAYLQPELSEYDAWFNVKDALLVLGVSVKNPAGIQNYYNRFLNFMKQHHQLRIHQQIREEKWLMPRILPGCPVLYGSGRVYFAGEAAGFLNPMGEGISAGMESGFCAARSIAAYFDTPDAIPSDYRNRTRPLKTYMEHQWGLTADLSDTFREMRI